MQTIKIFQIPIFQISKTQVFKIVLNTKTIFEKKAIEIENPHQKVRNQLQ